MKNKLKLASFALAVVLVLSSVSLFSVTAAAESEEPTAPSLSINEKLLKQANEATQFDLDLNGDGIVNTKDILYLRYVIAGIPRDVVKGSGDLNHDGIINTKDFLLFRVWIANRLGQV